MSRWVASRLIFFLELVPTLKVVILNFVCTLIFQRIYTKFFHLFTFYTALGEGKNEVYMDNFHWIDKLMTIFNRRLFHGNWFTLAALWNYFPIVLNSLLPETITISFVHWAQILLYSNFVWRGTQLIYDAWMTCQSLPIGNTSLRLVYNVMYIRRDPQKIQELLRDSWKFT